MLIRGDIDLRQDFLARRYLKGEVVTVHFAATAGSVSSREGANHYVAGDALITGSTGDQWSVSRERFDARYEAIAGTTPGGDGSYRNRPLVVLARQQQQAFEVQRSAGGDVIAGAALDWLLQYAPGDHGIVGDNKFRRLYRLAEQALDQP